MKVFLLDTPTEILVCLELRVGWLELGEGKLASAAGCDELAVGANYSCEGNSRRLYLDAGHSGSMGQGVRVLHNNCSHFPQFHHSIHIHMAFWPIILSFFAISYWVKCFFSTP